MSTAEKIAEIADMVDDLISDHDSRRVRIDIRRQMLASIQTELLRAVEEGRRSLNFLEATIRSEIEKLAKAEDDELAETGELRADLGGEPEPAELPSVVPSAPAPRGNGSGRGPLADLLGGKKE